MGLWIGTNNYAETMALKLLLCFSLEKVCRKLQIFRDSLVIINWVNKVQRCINLALSSLFEEVNRLWTNFDHISWRHVYRERNTTADRISKKGLKMEHGTWNFFENRDPEVYEFFHRLFIQLIPAENTSWMIRLFNNFLQSFVSLF